MGKTEEADLILKLYDLRREATMREARNWLFTFNPTSIQDVMETMMGEHSGHFRMVISYWDMACAMVTNGAIDEELFNQTNGEHIFVYMKVQPVLEDIRKMFDNPEFLKNLETVVKRIPEIETKLPAMRERMAKFAEMRTAKTQAAAS
ncbi:MAG: hypothetical protein DMF72_00235 [Acidobacteria bacterium]|nr:MAG: hypothetical protein DMF72_00235 [Acidobacteriota bacterium]